MNFPESPKLADFRRRLDERAAILDRLRQVIVRELDVRREPDEIDPDTPLFGSGLGLDSVDAVELIVCLDVEFGVEVADDSRARSALRTLNTVADLILSQQE